MARPAYGYTKSAGYPPFEELEHEQAVIRYVLALRLGGASALTITLHLRGLGITQRNGKRWTPTGVRRIIDRLRIAGRLDPVQAIHSPLPYYVR